LESIILISTFLFKFRHFEFSKCCNVVKLYLLYCSSYCTTVCDLRYFRMKEIMVFFWRCGNLFVFLQLENYKITKMAESKIYVVECGGGEWDDRVSWVERAFRRKEDAEAYAKL